MGLIEDLLDLEVPSQVRISPNGQQIVYTTTVRSRSKDSEHHTSTIWLAKTGHEKSAKQITSGKYNDKSPKWSSDGKSIAFTSDREKPGETNAIYILPLEVGGEAHALTPPGNERDVVDFKFSPDGKFVAYISADEKTPEKKQRDKDKDDANVWDEDLAYRRLRIVHVSTKKITTIRATQRHHQNLAWSPDGAQIAVLHQHDPTIDSQYRHGCFVDIVDLRGAVVRENLEFPLGTSNLVWVGDTLYFQANADRTHCSSSRALWSFHVKEEGADFQRRAHGVDDCLGDFVQAGQDIVVVGAQGLGDYIHMLDGRTLQTYKTEVASFDAKFTTDSDELILAVVKSGVGRPAELYSTTASGGAHVQLSDHGTGLSEHEFGTVDALSCQSDDGKVRLDSVYFSPSNAKGSDGSKGPFPTAVLVHGGPYGRCLDAFGTNAWGPLLLASGYGVLAPNYRGSSGRGDDFAAYARGGIGTVEYDDVITLTQNAIEKGFADKNHLMIGGWSQGGFMSFLASVRNGTHGHGWHFRAAIPGAGVADPDTMTFTSDMGMSFELEFSGVTPWNADWNELSGRRASSVWAFKGAVEAGVKIPPMLILHGEKDERVPFEQGVMMRRALQHHKLPFEFVSYPREPHGVSERMHVKDMMERVLRWADTHISPR